MDQIIQFKGRKKLDVSANSSQKLLLETMNLIQQWEIPDEALPVHYRSTFNPEKAIDLDTSLNTGGVSGMNMIMSFRMRVIMWGYECHISD